MRYLFENEKDWREADDLVVKIRNIVKKKPCDLTELNIKMSDRWNHQFGKICYISFIDKDGIHAYPKKEKDIVHCLANIDCLWDLPLNTLRKIYDFVSNCEKAIIPKISKKDGEAIICTQAAELSENHETTLIDSLIIAELKNLNEKAEKQQLYKTIIESIAIEVKKALNEEIID